jgi:hypothetical protein
MTYRHLSHYEGYQIAALMKAGQNQTQIAAILGRHKSTVSREIHRNTRPWGYRPRQASQLAALWLLQCHEYPRTEFDVNVRGIFNVMEACVAKGIKRLVYSSSASVFGDAVREASPKGRSY